MKPMDRILNALSKAIDEVNEQLPPGRKLEKSSETVLYGHDGHLDSIQLVSLIVAAEQEIEQEFKCVVVLADDKAVSQARSPFRTVGSLAEHILSRLHP